MDLACVSYEQLVVDVVDCCYIAEVGDHPIVMESLVEVERKVSDVVSSNVGRGDYDDDAAPLVNAELFAHD